MEWLGARSYPLSFAINQVLPVIPVIVYYFIAGLVVVSRVGGDYFTFVMIGIVGSRVLSAGVVGLGEPIDGAITEGRLEGILLQPVEWRLLPFALVQWPLAFRVTNVVLVVALALALGAHVVALGIPAAIGLCALGVVATLAIGTTAASIKVLAKRTDPVAAVYVLAVAVLSGVYYPLRVLPRALRPLSYVLPDTYVIAGVRHVLMRHGGSIGGPTALQAALALFAFDLVALPLALWLFGRSLDYARTLGVLGGY
jgi:ABC-2 type transport system permease protein